MNCIMTSLQHVVNASHLQSLKDEGPAPAPVMVHYCPGAGCALSEGAANQTVLREAPTQLPPSTAGKLHQCIHPREVSAEQYSLSVCMSPMGEVHLLCMARDLAHRAHKSSHIHAHILQ